MEVECTQEMMRGHPLGSIPKDFNAPGWRLEWVEAGSSLPFGGGLPLLPSDIIIEMGKGLSFLRAGTRTTEEYGKGPGRRN